MSGVRPRNPRSFRQERRQRIRELRVQGNTIRQIALVLAADPEGRMSSRRLSTYENWPGSVSSAEPKVSVLQGFAQVYRCAPGDLVDGDDYTDEPRAERDAGQPRRDGSGHGELMRLGTGQGAATGAVLRTFEAAHPDELRRILGLANVSAAKIEP